MLAVQRTVREAGLRLGSRSDRQAAQGLAVVRALYEAEASALRIDPRVGMWTTDTGAYAPSYLAHEFMNGHWSPCWHADVAAAMSEAQLDWVGAATLIENFVELAMTEAQRQVFERFDELLARGWGLDDAAPEVMRAVGIPSLTGDPVALAMFDIDHFKHYNDSHGHQEGNRVLQKVAELLRRTGRRGDVVARYGGEEFVALLYGATASDGWRFAEAFRSAIAAQGFPGEASQPLGRLTVSGGVATFPLDAQDDIGLIKAADTRLYRAKETGRNCTVGPEAAGT
jgi:diguanylate cyclase (GGDEF)-like protein